MPNHVQNIIEFDCGSDRAIEIMTFLRAEDEVFGSIDFNKLIPMPKSLDIEAGSDAYHGIEVFLTAVNPQTRDFGKEKMNPDAFEALVKVLNAEKSFNNYETELSEEELNQYAPFEEGFTLGMQAAINLTLYGATNWYEWRIKNWGSKWNAYELVELQPGDKVMTFWTAWSSVPRVIEKISVLYPDVPINYSWSDEDFGANVGKMSFSGGIIMSIDFPNDFSRHAYEIACEVWGDDFAEYEHLFEPKNQIDQVKKDYPPGTRLCLDYMADDPQPISPGTTGTVDYVDDIGTVHCSFDNGRSLGLVLGADRYHKVTEASGEY